MIPNQTSDPVLYWHENTDYPVYEIVQGWVSFSDLKINLFHYTSRFLKKKKKNLNQLTNLDGGENS